MSKIVDKLREKAERNKEIKFIQFLQDRVDEFNRAEIYANKTKDLMNTGNYIRIIFGTHSENLDRLIIDIQSSEEWKNINTKSKKLLTLNSDLKNNRKKLRKWLFEHRPTKNLSRHLACEDKIKANIARMLEIVKNGRALIEPAFNDPQSRYIYDTILHTPKLSEQSRSEYDHHTIIKLQGIKDELEIIILHLKHLFFAIEIFGKDWQEQSEKDNVMLVNLNELIEWYKDSENECVIANAIVRLKEIESVYKFECERECEREKERVRVSVESKIECKCESESESESESEANKLKKILNALYLFDK